MQAGFAQQQYRLPFSSMLRQWPKRPPAWSRYANDPFDLRRRLCSRLMCQVVHELGQKPPCGVTKCPEGKDRHPRSMNLLLETYLPWHLPFHLKRGHASRRSTLLPSSPHLSLPLLFASSRCNLLPSTQLSPISSASIIHLPLPFPTRAILTGRQHSFITIKLSRLIPGPSHD